MNHMYPTKGSAYQALGLSMHCHIRWSRWCWPGTQQQRITSGSSRPRRGMLRRWKPSTRARLHPGTQSWTGTGLRYVIAAARAVPELVCCLGMPTAHDHGLSVSLALCTCSVACCHGKAARCEQLSGNCMAERVLLCCS